MGGEVQNAAHASMSLCCFSGTALRAYAASILSPFCGSSERFLFLEKIRRWADPVRHARSIQGSPGTRRRFQVPRFPWSPRKENAPTFLRTPARPDNRKSSSMETEARQGAEYIRSEAARAIDDEPTRAALSKNARKKITKTLRQFGCEQIGFADNCVDCGLMVFGLQGREQWWGNRRQPVLKTQRFSVPWRRSETAGSSMRRICSKRFCAPTAVTLQR
jgi:hypothetical protein